MCPSSHPYAFVHGHECCSGKTKDGDTCENAIPCPATPINGQNCISGNYLMFVTFVSVFVSVSFFFIIMINSNSSLEYSKCQTGIGKKTWHGLLVGHESGNSIFTN